MWGTEVPGVVWSPWDELARAELTLTFAHGERKLATRVLLADGRILQQINPGLPDLENAWHETARFTSLDDAVAELRREGWSVRRADQRGGGAADRT
ncbi:MAG: hypothetical protein KGK07_14140 [Chloroflexota bacterium]|nr:hypothetical protein [Chloroflexota bacterium]